MSRARIAPEFTIEKLAPGVHAAIARPGGHALSNSTIVDLGETTVLFDSMLTPRAGVALRRAARRLTGRYPEFVVDSHYHHDHVWGSGAAGPVHVIATRRTRELLARQGRDAFVALRREVRRDLARLDAPGSDIAPVERPFFRGWFRGILSLPPSFTVRVPDLTFTTELTLHGSRRTLELITRGGGHSPSDLFGHLPDERISLLGDLVVTRMHPSVSDGYPREWLRILRAIRQLGAERVVPGHGPVGGARDVTAVAEYLRTLSDLARRAIRQGVPLRSIEVPERYRGWSGTPFFQPNLARVYRDLRRRTRIPT